MVSTMLSPLDLILRPPPQERLSPVDSGSFKL
jgi:hypothetical protein